MIKTAFLSAQYTNGGRRLTIVPTRPGRLECWTLTSESDDLPFIDPGDVKVVLHIAGIFLGSLPTPSFHTYKFHC
ncbi:uncharacterized protein ARMOST_02499 [Armillaria ostoyae]|uniref:Uncharacterized protein n=1 Tax=Armillaria ostoyae TaxID=47428 RepID=A0A284QRV5_ARMOS|nr:uncharacterized protein ARMOST_02499 [Armillaria ostoyae]